MAMAGVDRWTHMELSDWQSGEMLDEIYPQVTSAHMHEAMQGTGVGKGWREEPESEGEGGAEVELLTLVRQPPDRLK